jgi:hypothetical protein
VTVTVAVDAAVRTELLEAAAETGAGAAAAVGVGTDRKRERETVANDADIQLHEVTYRGMKQTYTRRVLNDGQSLFRLLLRVRAETRRVGAQVQRTLHPIYCW